MNGKNIVPFDIPEPLKKLFGSQLVLSTEDPQAYQALFDQVARALMPTDAIEWLWVGDIVHHSWETWRLRSFKNQFIEQTQKAKPGRSIAEGPMAGAIAAWKRAAAGNGAPPIAVTREAPPEPDTTPPTISDSVDAFKRNLDVYERTDRLLLSAELRRNVALREIESYRSAFGQKAREVSDQIVDGVFTEVDATIEGAERLEPEHDDANKDSSQPA